MRLNGWQRLHRQGALLLSHVPQSVSGHLDQDIRAPAQAKQGFRGTYMRNLIEEATGGGFIVGLRNRTPAFPTQASITKTDALALLPLAKNPVNQIGGRGPGLTGPAPAPAAVGA